MTRAAQPEAEPEGQTPGDLGLSWRNRRRRYLPVLPPRTVCRASIRDADRNPAQAGCRISGRTRKETVPQDGLVGFASTLRRFWSGRPDSNRRCHVETAPRPQRRHSRTPRRLRGAVEAVPGGVGYVSLPRPSAQVVRLNREEGCKPRSQPSQRANGKPRPAALSKFFLFEAPRAWPPPLP